MKLKVTAICCLLVLAGATGSRAHSPTVDADFSDWCFDTDIRPQDTWAVLTCALGTETAWFDGENDNLIINDFNVLATTSDASRLYFAASLYNDPDPASIPSAQVLIDVVPGGGNVWVDIENNLPTTKGVAVNSLPALGADFNLVFDFANFLIGSPDSGELRVWDPEGDPNSCAPTLGPADCIRDGWRWLRYLQPAINPGQPGGSGGPPGGIELGIPWTSFACEGCPSFGPTDGFRYTFMVAQGDVLLPLFTPGGPIEDNISEASAGAYTTTVNSCATPGTSCELNDGSSDGFVNGGPPAGDVENLLVANAGETIDLSWDSSCIVSDGDYAVYQGEIGSFDDRTNVTCTTAGMTSYSMEVPSDSVFFLVVPRSGISANATEGSYGQDGSGAERAPAAVGCGPQVPGECP